jgi:hypothetical protein
LWWCHRGRCGGGPTTPTANPGPTSLPPLTALEVALNQAYEQAFNEKIVRPAIFNPSCAAARVTSTAYLGPFGKSSTLLTLYSSRDGGSVTWRQRATFLTPAGRFQVLAVVVRYPQTVGDDAISLLEAAQRQINEDHASFARARGYGAPIV